MSKTIIFYGIELTDIVVILTKVENFRYIGRNIVNISDIGTHRHDIGNRQLFEGKIGKNLEKSVIYRRYISPKPIFWLIFWH